MEFHMSDGETRIAEESFRPSLLLFWHKAQMVLTNRRILGSAPNTILGLIPMGKEDITQPLKNVSVISVSTKFRVFRFLIGIVLLLGGMSSGEAAGVVLGLIGVLFIALSFTAELWVGDSSGGGQDVDVSWLDKSAAEAFARRASAEAAAID